MKHMYFCSPTINKLLRKTDLKNTLHMKTSRKRPHTILQKKDFFYKTTRTKGESKKRDTSKWNKSKKKQIITGRYLKKNILKDPFARQVFEDIFREVKKRSIYHQDGKLDHVVSYSPVERIKKSWIYF